MKINDNFLKLEGSYLFSTVARKQREYQEAHPDKEVIRLSIGDVTKPLAPAVIEAMHKAVDEMANEATFRGYPPEHGYDFLVEAIHKNDYEARGLDISKDEIFVSDGAKSDCGNIGDIFSLDNKVAICDPVYPVYLDSNIMSGRTDIIYMPCTAENGFMPQLPSECRILFIFASQIIPSALPQARISLRFGLIMPLSTARLFFMILLMRLLLRTAPLGRFMRLKAQKNAQSNFVRFQKQQASPAFAAATPLFLRILNSAAQALTLFGHAGRQQSLTA